MRLVPIISPEGVQSECSPAAADRLAGCGWRPVTDQLPTDAPSAEVPKGNASRDAWAQYATSIGIQVDPEWNRDEIKDAVENPTA